MIHNPLHWSKKDIMADNLAWYFALGDVINFGVNRYGFWENNDLKTEYYKLLDVMRIFVDDFVNVIKNPASGNKKIYIHLTINILAMKIALEEDMVSDDPNPTLKMYKKAAEEVKCFEDYIIESSKN